MHVPDFDIRNGALKIDILKAVSWTCTVLYCCSLGISPMVGSRGLELYGADEILASIMILGVYFAPPSPPSYNTVASFLPIDEVTRSSP